MLVDMRVGVQVGDEESGSAEGASDSHLMLTSFRLLTPNR